MPKQNDYAIFSKEYLDWKKWALQHNLDKLSKEELLDLQKEHMPFAYSLDTDTFIKYVDKIESELETRKITNEDREQGGSKAVAYVFIITIVLIIISCFLIIRKIGG